MTRNYYHIINSWLGTSSPKSANYTEAERIVTIINHPTSAPTKFISYKPTSAVASYLPEISRIREVTSTTTSTKFQITLSISIKFVSTNWLWYPSLSLASEGTSKGTVYCLAAKSGQTSAYPSSRDKIKASGSSYVYKSGKSETFNLTVSSLSALTYYELFCLVSTASGLQTSKSTALESIYSFETTCCHKISFSSYPTSIRYSIRSNTTSAT
jgi:hypothetical protein